MAEKYIGLDNTTLVRRVLQIDDERRLQNPSGKTFRVLQISGSDGNEYNMIQPIYKNQAIATITATYTPDGLVLADGRKPRTYLHPKAKTWLSNKMLPFQFEGTFRVWPRYNRDGLKSVEVVGIAPREQGGIVGRQSRLYGTDLDRPYDTWI